MKTSRFLSCLSSAYFLFLLLPGGVAMVRGGDLEVLLAGPTGPVPAGRPVSLWLHWLNGSGVERLSVVARAVAGEVGAGDRVEAVPLELREPREAGEIAIPPGGFVRREYQVVIPDSCSGWVTLWCPGLTSNRLAVEVRPAGAADPAAQPPARSGLARWLQEAEPAAASAETGPMRFFKQHFFGYEPIYFIVGPDSPNARFQVSLRYQIVNRDGPLAHAVPPLKGLNVAYSQTSLWDWNAPSAPFFDSSYRPELLYLWQRVDRGRWADWLRLDLQAGFQHESNGKDGAASRSLNIGYLRPTLTLGEEGRLQFALSPRVWVYLGDLSDNPDVADYRGHVDLRASLGWARGLQLAATGRLGDTAEHGSLQLDLTYPMMDLLSGSFSVYLQAQYFTGYGESLLMYNERSDAFRAGFALYR